jgi:hypothetical protein
MDIKITRNNQIICEEKNISDDRQCEIFATMKKWENKSKFNVFLEHGLTLTCTNLADIFD